MCVVEQQQKEANSVTVQPPTTTFSIIFKATIPFSYNPLLFFQLIASSFQLQQSFEFSDIHNPMIPTSFSLSFTAMMFSFLIAQWNIHGESLETLN